MGFFFPLSHFSDMSCVTNYTKRTLILLKMLITMLSVKGAVIQNVWEILPTLLPLVESHHILGSEVV